MSPEVTAAAIAAGVSVLTLIGTLAAQYFGRLATRRDTRQALEEQREQLARTLAEQRTRALNERFATAAGQLGSDKPPVQLAGVYAMAGLADDWEKNRQTCVDVLCAYLRMPYEPDPGPDAPEPQRLAFQATRVVRHTVIAVITEHLREDAAVSWQGLTFHLTGAVFDGADFRWACFSGGTVNFNNAEFCGPGWTFFSGAQFSGAGTLFSGAQFSGGTVDFSGAQFSGGRVEFSGANFCGAEVYFRGAQFTGTEVDFVGVEHLGGAGYFGDTQFSGGTVDFSDVSDWSFPPTFPWTDAAPPTVKLPEEVDPSQG